MGRSFCCAGAGIDDAWPRFLRMRASGSRKQPRSWPIYRRVAKMRRMPISTPALVTSVVVDLPFFIVTVFVGLLGVGSIVFRRQWAELSIWPFTRSWPFSLNQRTTIVQFWFLIAGVLFVIVSAVTVAAGIISLI